MRDAGRANSDLAAWLRQGVARKAADAEAVSAVGADLLAEVEAAELFSAKVLAGIWPVGSTTAASDTAAAAAPGQTTTRGAGDQTAIARRLRCYTGAGDRAAARVPQLLNFAEAPAAADRRSVELRSEAARLATFKDSGVDQVAAAQLAAAGFHWLPANSGGGGGVVRCAFCRGNLDRRPGESPMAAHARQFGTCPFVLRLDVGNAPAQETTGTRACAQCEQAAGAAGTPWTGGGSGAGLRQLDSSEEAALVSAASPLTVSSTVSAPDALRNLEALEACAADIGPRWPEFADPGVRLRSMIGGCLSRLPCEAPPADLLASAGFFFLTEAGRRHYLRCYSCGLRLAACPAGWDPWVAHAVRSPRCPHLLTTRGAAFVRRARDRIQLAGPDAPPASASGGAPFAVVEPRPESLGQFHFRLDPREVRARADSPAARDAERILGGGGGGGGSGSCDAEVRAATELRLATAGDDFACPERLLADVLSQRAERLLSSEAPLEAEDFAAERLRRLRAAWPTEPPPLQEADAAWRACKVCLDRRADVLLLSCGHFCCCSRCSRSLGACPICRAAIWAELPVNV